MVMGSPNPSGKNWVLEIKNPLSKNRACSSPLSGEEGSLVAMNGHKEIRKKFEWNWGVVEERKRHFLCRFPKREGRGKREGQ